MFLILWSPELFFNMKDGSTPGFVIISHVKKAKTPKDKIFFLRHEVIKLVIIFIYNCFRIFYSLFLHQLFCWRNLQINRSRDRFWKEGVHYVGHHGWLTKKILDFRWSKKAKITLEAITSWTNISISIFKFSPFLYIMKACRWNLINFWNGVSEVL